MQTTGGATPLMYACQQCMEKEVLEILRKQPNAVKVRDRTLKTPLHYCAENPNTSCAEAVLKAAPELVNAQDENGYCTLHLAVIAGNKPLIKLLISKGADVNIHDREGHSSVHWAIVSSEKEALEMIVRAGADPSTPDIHGGYPLHYAVQICGPNCDYFWNFEGTIRVVETLLNFGVDVNVKDKDGRQPILWAASAGSADAVIHLVSGGACVEAADKDGLTALHCAASRGHTTTLETLISLCGANVDVIDGNGCSALFYSVTLGHADATELLLRLGADPNRQDRKGRTPAHCGAAKGQLETLRILQKHGGNLWTRNVKGDIPLHEAVASGRKDLVLWLLSQNPEAINLANNDGRCPLHIASMYNNTEMVKVLLDSKSLVNPIMRTSKGILMTPLNVALYKGHRSCGKYLQLHGGVPFSKVSKIEPASGFALRVSPSDDTIIVETNKENIMSSQSKISKSRSSTDIQENQEIVKAESADKKKVYRRRKKKKNLSNVNPQDSDSNDSMQDLKVKFPDERKTSDESEEKRKTKKVHLDTKEVEKENLIKVDLETVSAPPIEVTEVAKKTKVDSKMLQRNKSFNETKNVSDLTPEDFPPQMQAINQLDVVIMEPDIEVAKPENESAELQPQGPAAVDLRFENAEPTSRSSAKTTASAVDMSVSNVETVTVVGNNSGTNTNTANVDTAAEVNISDTNTGTAAEVVNMSDTNVGTAAEVVSKGDTDEGTAAEVVNMIGSNVGTAAEAVNISGSNVSTTAAAVGSRGDNQTAKTTSNKEENESVVDLISTSSNAPPNKEEMEERVAKDSANMEMEERVAKGSAKMEKEKGPQSEEKPVKSRGEKKQNGGNPKSETGTKSDGSRSSDEGSGRKSVKSSKTEGNSFKKDLNTTKRTNGGSETVEKTVQKHQVDSKVSKKSPEAKDHSKEENNDKSEAKTENDVKEEEQHTSNSEISENSKKAENSAEIAKPESVQVTDSEKAKSSDQVTNELDDPAQKQGNFDTLNSASEKEAAEEIQMPAEEINTDTKIDTNHVIVTADTQELEGKNDEEIANLVEEGNITEPDQNEEAAVKILSAPEHTSEKIDYGDTEAVAAEVPSEEITVHMIEKRSANLSRPNEKLEDKSRQTAKNQQQFDAEKNEVGNPSGNNTNENITTDPNKETSENSDEEDETRGRKGNGPEQRQFKTPRVSRLCRRQRDFKDDMNEISVTQLVQNTIRKYHMERGIFFQLLELKRYQIRSGKANEQVLVKRLADEYERSRVFLGMKPFSGLYKFREFEKFLYDQLKLLNTRRSFIIPDAKFYDDIDALSGFLKKSRYKIISEIPRPEMDCTCITQRCHHSACAYTSVPCSAYVTDLRRHRHHKPKRECFFPRIEQPPPSKSETQKYVERPATLELIQGGEKHVITLPQNSPAKGKRYYVTFTIKGAPELKGDESEDNPKNFLKHRHSKSV